MDRFWQVGTDGELGRGRIENFPDGTWMTSFPPPPGFDGYENTPFDGDNWYERICTAEEVELLEAAAAGAEAEVAGIIAFAGAQRERFFARLRRDLGQELPVPAAQASPETTGT